MAKTAAAISLYALGTLRAGRASSARLRRSPPRCRRASPRDGEGEVAPRRRDAPVDVAPEDVRAEDEHEADDDQERLRGEVDDRQEDVEAGGLLDADDVDGDEQDDDDCAADDVPRVLAQRLPEDGEVVRDEEGRDGDGGDVDEHLRPGAPKLTSSLKPWRAKLEEPPASG